MNKKIPMGISDYRKLKENNYYAVDKSMMIFDFLKRQNEVTLITRPRRFGKTLNMSMLAEFFDIIKDSKEIFKDTDIMKTEYTNQINSYPVIYLTFANAKENLKNAVQQIKSQISDEYKKYKFLLTDFDEYDKPFFDIIRKSLDAPDNESLEGLDNAISFLSHSLESYYQRKVMLFIDEYDTPFIDAHVGGYYEKLHSNLSIMLSSALKNNDSLQYAMLTGIQRVAKENIFSGLNNLKVCTVADQEYAQYFGFSEEETKSLLHYYGLEYTDDVKEMYDGYRIGNQDIYNPWSIINYADSKKLITYWVNTSANRMIQKAMESCDRSFQQGYEALIKDGYLETTVLMGTSFFEQSQTSSLWGLFVNAGYLTIQQAIDEFNGRYRLCIPNQEVGKEFVSLTASYLNMSETSLTDLCDAIRYKKKEIFLQTYQDILMSDISYYDLKEENSYHAFLLGMCICLKKDYVVKSNQESGKGRADIMLQAKKEHLPSYVIEMKYTKDEHQNLTTLAQKAIEQMEKNQYGYELKGTIIHIGLAHHKKEVEMIWKETEAI